MLRGGKIKHFMHEWTKYTSDPFILSCVSGCKLFFLTQPSQDKLPHPIKLCKEQQLALNSMLCEFVADGVIEKCEREKGDFVSTVFLREKRTFADTTKKYRMILNVKQLNIHVEYVHFKMDTLESCLNLMDPDCYMASIDLENAYHSVPIHPDYTKFFKFLVGNQLYKYCVLPQGYRDSPRIFTKLTKPVVAHLHDQGILCSFYIDDLYVQGTDFDDCQSKVKYAVGFLESLGFDISPKSILTPTKELHHLGFLLNSQHMVVSLSPEKEMQVRRIILNVLNQPMSVRTLAQVIGTLVACFPAVEYGQLYYRQLENFKIQSLKVRYDFDRVIVLPKEAIDDLQWWLNEGLLSKKMLVKQQPSITIKSDSSGYAYGAVMNNTTVTHGMWCDTERQEHINVLELKAAMLAVQSFCREIKNCHVRIEIDNTTAVSYINHMGGTHSPKCDAISRQLILWCKARGIWLSACHIAGKDNCSADSYSRKQSIHTEWTLNTEMFDKVCNVFGKPAIDLFASRTNHQLPRYMSLYPDPAAEAINAFYHPWTEYVYIFPPFNLIPRVLKKLREEGTVRALVIVPEWKTQTWFPKLEKMRVGDPIHLNPSKTLLVLPSDTKAIHPLYPKLSLMACILSGKE